jgi:trk system potassium uptake protein TrkH
MFVGGGPGSCAGGVKVTTIASIFLVGLSRFRHQYRPQVFSRAIAESSISKAMSVVLASVFVVAVGCGCLLITELKEVPHSESRGEFLELLFEMVSAFGTVGLSTGVTEGLTVLGRLTITVAMFMGRLGPLVVALAVTRTDTPPRFRFAWERIMIG